MIDDIHRKHTCAYLYLYSPDPDKPRGGTLKSLGKLTSLNNVRQPNLGRESE